MVDVLVYRGATPVFAYRMDFVPEQKVPMNKVFDAIGSLCPTSDKPDRTFSEWVSKFVGSEFEVMFDQAEESNGPKKRGRKPKNKITVESSSVSTSSSLEDAHKALKKMGHPDAVGEIKPFESKKSSKTDRQVADEVSSNGSVVLTGDMLESRAEVSGKNNRRPATVLDPDGQARVAEPLSEEMQKIIDSQMAEATSGAKVLTPTTVDQHGNKSSSVVGGSSFEGDLEHAPGYKSKVVSESKGRDKVEIKGRNNKKYQSFPSAPEIKQVKLEDIMSNPNRKEVLNAVKRCKDGSVLKQAKLYAKNKGDSPLVEAIELQIMRLGPLV